MSDFSYPTELEIVPLKSPPNVTVSVPGSKSITNRALVLAALTSSTAGSELIGALHSEDTDVMVKALRQLGYDIFTRWDLPNPLIRVGYRPGPRIPSASADLFVANSGTTVRFLTAMLALGHGRYRLDGVPRMRERPIQDLLDAMNGVGGVCAFSETGNECPPVVIESKGMAGGHVRVRADVSSQYLSGLLMAAPFAASPVTIHIEGPIVSEPYIDMTVELMKLWHLKVERRSSREYFVPNYTGRPHPDNYWIEPDASAASYFFAAAAITGGRVGLSWRAQSGLQGDIKFVDALEKMGCRKPLTLDGISVYAPEDGRLRGIDVDMNAISDTVMTLAAVACFADGPTTIRNVAHIRHKETDRIAAVATELRKLGAEVEEYPDGLKITPRPLTGCAVETYNDHRMAMSLALIGLKVPGVVIKNPGCVAKTYPGFWQDFEKLRG